MRFEGQHITPDELDAVEDLETLREAVRGYPVNEATLDLLMMLKETRADLGEVRELVASTVKALGKVTRVLERLTGGARETTEETVETTVETTVEEGG